MTMRVMNMCIRMSFPYSWFDLILIFPQISALMDTVSSTSNPLREA